MSFNRAKNIPFEDKVKAVETYLQKKQSLRKIAGPLGISHPSVWLWVKLYKEGGKENLREVRLHKKRISGAIEKKIMFLKENNPSLSIRKAKSLMVKEGIKVSNKGIWGVWKRFGLSKRNVHDPFYPFVEFTHELKNDIERARGLLQNGNQKEAAKILNSLPCMPEDPILKDVPEKYLSPRKRLERLYLELDENPFPVLATKARELGGILEKKGFIYSSMIVNFMELNFLSWMGKSEEKITLLDHLVKKMQGVKDSVLWFFFYFEQAYTYCDLLQIQKALNFIKKCRKLAYLLPYPKYWDYLGGFFTNTGDYKKVLLFYKKSFERENKKGLSEQYAVKLAFGYCMSGEYSKCKYTLAKASITQNMEGVGTLYNLTNANMSFGIGNLVDAHEFFIKSLRSASKGELLNVIYSSSLGLAVVAMSLNKRSEAEVHLKKYRSLMIKNKLKRDALILKCLLNSQEVISEKSRQLPPLFLLNLLMQAKRKLYIGGYRRAYDYAKRKGLLGLFHRWIVFFPEIVLRLLERGKQTGLPRAILKFPIFNQKMPVYHIKFLGNFVVFKNQQYLKIKLSPKEKALLIQVALRANEPYKIIPSKELFSNFWPKSDKPVGLLSHLLMKIKKKLMMSGHLIGISVRYLEPALVNRGLYFTTDYNDFEISLAQAKALERAGEWGFAKKEYLRAFKLFRGEPFKKNYDNWSLDLRHRILTQIETEAINFTKSCLEHGNKKDTRKVLEKVLKIIPDSEEIKNLLNGNWLNS